MTDNRNVRRDYMDVMANKTVECSLDDGVQVVLNMLDK